MNKNIKVNEYILFRRDKLTEQINELSSKMKKLEYEKMECLRKLEEIKKNQDIGKNVFFVDKSESKFAENEILQIKDRINVIEQEIDKYQTKWQGDVKEKQILDDIITETKEEKENQPVMLDRYLIQEEIYQTLANYIKNSYIQESICALQKSELCENIIEFDIMRTKFMMEDINQFLRESIQKMRNFIYYVNPIIMQNQNLEKNIIRLIDLMENQVDVNISFKKNGEIYDVETEIIWIVIRFMQCVITTDEKISAEIRLEYLEEGIKIYVVCNSMKNEDSSNDKLVYEKKSDEENYVIDMEVIKEKIIRMGGILECVIDENVKTYKLFIPINSENYVDD